MKIRDIISYVIFRSIFLITLVCLLGKLIIPRTSFYFKINLYYKKFGLILNKNDITLVKGESTTLTVMSLNKRLEFISTDYKVAFVNVLGRVTGIHPGMAFIKVKVEGRTLKCRVHVIDLNRRTLTLNVGDSRYLNVRGAPFYREHYKTNNPSVAMVSNHGKVTAVGKGEALIAVTCRGKKMFCKVVVK
ncbi:MAG: hypothetical protein E7256_03000 [Lachnospiraceae bacterium]|nr:hypothetical protein [Lachnospiraceae bacterium]